jgi:hypothetical protein
MKSSHGIHGRNIQSRDSGNAGEENQFDSLYFEKDYEKIREVRNLTKTLFMALGFDKNQKLEGVEFYNENHK